MRALPETLATAQQSTSVKALFKLVLTYNSTTYTYTKTRILDIEEKENGPLQSLKITLSNSDKALTDLDFKGYQGVLHNGVVTSRGEEYDACAPMWVISQQFNSDPNKLECTLFLEGICNLMARDAANAAYQPDSDDTKSVKTLVDAIAGATLDCFDHCTAYDVVWEVGYDDLADTYTPKDAFRIYVGNNRLSAINRLLDYTKNVAVAKADGKIHIFQPTTSGSTYDYEYSLESGHPFFAKALRNTLVIPNYIKVQSREDDDPSYSGTATNATSFALLPKAEYKQTYLASNAQGAAIAAAILAKAEMWCEAGSANVPMNVGAEVYDYVKVTDEREDDYRVGNIGRLVRHVNLKKNEWRITFTFGDWQNVRKALDQLGITADDIENYFSRLYVKDLYAENIYLDDIIDGPDNYQRVLSVALNASGMVLLDQVVEGTFGRVKKASLSAAGLVLLDQVVEGSYGLTLATDISAGHILLSKTVKDGKWHEESGVVIDATYGIALYGGEGINAFRTFATEADYLAGTPVQVYVGTDGKLYAGGGNVILDENGVSIKDECLYFYHGSSKYGVISTKSTSPYTLKIFTLLDAPIEILSDDYLWLTANSGNSDVIVQAEYLRPSVNNTYHLGHQSYQWATVYGVAGNFSERLKIPVGTDMYD